MENESVQNPAPVELPVTPPVLSAENLVRLSQGLSTIQWMAPLAFCLVGLGIFAPPLALLPQHFLWQILAFGAVTWGLIRLRSAGAVGGDWNRWTTGAAWAAGLCAYFSLFVNWWRLETFDLHLLANVMGLCGSGVALVILLLLALVELARALGQETLMGDFRTALFVSLLLGILPLAATLMSAYVMHDRQDDQYSMLLYVGAEFSDLLRSMTRWKVIGLAALCIFPVAVLLTGIWKLKSEVVRLLQNK